MSNPPIGRVHLAEMPEPEVPVAPLPTCPILISPADELVLEEGVTEVLVKWYGLTGVPGYNVYVWPSEEDMPEDPTDTTTSNSVLVTGLDVNTEYNVLVNAVNVNGESVGCITHTFSTVETIPPDPCAAMPSFSGAYQTINNPFLAFGASFSSATVMNMAYENNTFLMYGGLIDGSAVERSYVSRSTDEGATWTTPVLIGTGVTPDFLCKPDRGGGSVHGWPRLVAYGQGKWVFAGVDRTTTNLVVAATTDFSTWTHTIVGAADGFRNPGALRFANGVWIFTATNGVCYTSPDGLTWTSRTFFPDFVGQAERAMFLEYVPLLNRWVAGNLVRNVTHNGYRYSNNNGVTWLTPTAPFTSVTGPYQVGAVNQSTGFMLSTGDIAGSGTGVEIIRSSSDGITWTARDFDLGLVPQGHDGCKFFGITRTTNDTSGNWIISSITDDNVAVGTITQHAVLDPILNAPVFRAIAQNNTAGSGKVFIVYPASTAASPLNLTTQALRRYAN